MLIITMKIIAIIVLFSLLILMIITLVNEYHKIKNIFKNI